MRIAITENQRFDQKLEPDPLTQELDHPVHAAVYVLPPLADSSLYDCTVYTQHMEPLEMERANAGNRNTKRWKLINKWTGLSAAMIMMGCSGLTYTYAVYSELIKKRLHYSQERIDVLGAAKDFGAIAGLLSGLCYFLFPPWVSIVIGAAMHFFGYLMILLTLTGRFGASFWLLCFSAAIGTGGDNWIDTACIMTILENFKHHKGTGVGILKSQLGLSAAIFVTVYQAFLESGVSNFLGLITVVPSVAYVTLAFLVKPYPVYEDALEEADTSRRLKLISTFIVILGIFLMVSMTVERVLDLEDIAEKFVATIMLAILGTMLLIPIVHKPLDQLRALLGVQQVEPSVGGSAKGCLDDKEQQEGEHGALLRPEIENLKDKEDLMEQITTHALYHSSQDSLLGIDFWLLSFVVSSGAGAGLAIINNFAQIGKAVETDAVNAFIGIISIWSCFGRLISGYGSDVMTNAGYSRPICLLISQTAMCICCLLLSSGFVPFLFIGSAVTGLAYGSYWTLTPTIISEVFGLRQVATLYKLLGLGPAVAAYILSAKVLGYLYDKEALFYKQQNSTFANEHECYGKRCFEFGLIYLASVCFIGVIACFWFTNRTKRVYSRIGSM